MSKSAAAWMMITLLRVAFSVTVSWLLAERLTGYFTLVRGHFRSFLP